jgi:ABC-type Mn2+/Zn2+ transport system permease subunit
VRSIVAVVVGYLVFAGSAVALFQVSGQAPHAPASLPFMLGSTLYGILFAALGGYLAARLVPRRPELHGAAVAALIALGAAASLVARHGTGSVWSQVSAVLLMAPAAWGGGYLRARHAADGA